MSFKQVALAAAVACPAAGNTDLVTIPTVELDRLFVQVSVATQALDAFIVQARSSEAASFTTLYSAASDFTAPVGLMVGASGDLTTLAAGNSGWFILDTRGLYEVKLQASGAVNNASVTIQAGGR